MVGTGNLAGGFTGGWAAKELFSQGAGDDGHSPHTTDPQDCVELELFVMAGNPAVQGVLDPGAVGAGRCEEP